MFFRIVLLVLVHIAVNVNADLTYYVSVSNGDDKNPGTIGEPFKTIEKAKQTVRNQLRLNYSKQITVIIRGGVYRLSAPLQFNPLDSGKLAAPIVYRAFCNTSLANSLVSNLKYSSVANSNVSIRSLWNGVGNISQWKGPTNPFLYFNINETNNSLINSQNLRKSGNLVSQKDIICLDKVGVGKSCFQGAVGKCINGCRTSCLNNVDRKYYSEEVYTQFDHLFGKDLKKEEDCIEMCSESCQECERVEITGFLPISTPWKKFKSISANVILYSSNVSSIFLSSEVLRMLYVNSVPFQLARYPNMKDPYSEGYVNSNSSITFENSTYSKKVLRWSNVKRGQIHVLPIPKSHQNIIFNIKKANLSDFTFHIGKGGGQLSAPLFINRLNSSKKVKFFVENIFEELDVPGEWYYDKEDKMLYICSNNEFLNESPVVQTTIVQQLVTVIGKRDISYIKPGFKTAELYEETTEHATKTTSNPSLVTNLHFKHIYFTGTSPSYFNTYESLPGSEWTATRVAAIYAESVHSLEVSKCTFNKIGGNAMIISGYSESVNIVHNNIYDVGGTAISILARTAYRLNSFRQRVKERLLYSTNTNISYNRIFSYGRITKRSAAILVVGSSMTTVYRNLVHNISSGGVSYQISNTETGITGSPLIHPISKVSLPITEASILGGYKYIIVPVKNLDIDVVAKIIGGPACNPGSGRIGSVHGQHHSGCSGCCVATSTSAVIRKFNGGVDWSKCSNSVALSPGDSFELRITSATIFNAPSDIFVGLHKVEPNQIIDIPWYVRWTVRVRPCKFKEFKYTALCGGPCGCGSSAEEMTLKGPSCSSDYDIDERSTVCKGPFEGWSKCNNNGTARTVTYYNCSATCIGTSCT